jgi:hypothetical protein
LDSEVSAKIDISRFAKEIKRMSMMILEEKLILILLPIITILTV